MPITLITKAWWSRRVTVLTALQAGFSHCVLDAADCACGRIRLGAVERYSEVLSGALIALMGLIFLLFLVL